MQHYPLLCCYVSGLSIKSLLFRGYQSIHYSHWFISRNSINLSASSSTLLSEMQFVFVFLISILLSIQRESRFLDSSRGRHTTHKTNEENTINMEEFLLSLFFLFILSQRGNGTLCYFNNFFSVFSSTNTNGGKYYLFT